MPRALKFRPILTKDFSIVSISILCKNETKCMVIPKAAIKTVFQNICFFFPGPIFLQFSRRVNLFVEQTCFFPVGSIYSSNRHVFPSYGLYYVLQTDKLSRRVYQTDMFYQEGSICSSTDLIISSNRY